MPEVGPHLLGALPSPPDGRDHPLSAHAIVLQTFPPVYNVPTIVAPLKQDGGKCVGFSGVLEQTLKEWPEAQGEVDFSGDDLYILCVPGDYAGTKGTYIRTACNVLVNTGALVVGGVRPVGERLKIASYASVSLTQSEMKTAIQLGGCWIGLTWANSWFHPNSYGVLPPFDTAAGGHAIIIIGWDDTTVCPDGTKGAWLLQNSWGASWGQGGRCWFPYSYISHVWEAWKTFDAPDPEVIMAFTPIGNPTGVARVGTDSNIRGIRADNVLVPIPLGDDVPFYGETTINGYAIDGTSTSAVYTLGKASDGVLVYLLKRNATLMPIGVGPTSFTIAGTVSGAAATVTWK